jgi:hypothetical protein
MTKEIPGFKSNEDPINQVEILKICDCEFDFLKIKKKQL